MPKERRGEGAAPGAGEAAEALRRIAYLLETQRAESYKVRAFRRAAASLDEAGGERVRALAAAGRLTDLPGVGATTAAIAAEALDGAVPAYERELQERAGAPLDDAVAAMLASLRGDLHCHSDWSDGGSTIVEMASAAAAMGHEYLALTDHSPRLTVAHGLDPERLRRQLEVVAEVNARLAPFRLLSGIEVDILEDGSLDQDEELLAELDVVVASVHSKLRMDADAMTERMVRAVRNPLTDILGHCTGRIIVGRGRPPSTFDADAVFGACAASGTAVEINSRPERRDPPPELLRQAVEAGCLVSIDSDAHAPGQLEWRPYGCEQAVEAGLGAERVVNAWPLDRLCGWTASHQA
jgi:putative hydrolase